ncbi:MULTISPECIES: hypothetical protein [Bacillus subtilis group]|uniref:Uncharacterized protein n=2 Tax=root TaxID=1 RepID=Q9ZXC6_BPPH1|nr:MULTISPECIES: hypothetical protein [Bacillus subtilis group]NP_690793.1 hypothetical protein phi105_40 [Bacillus phage phi105]YP_009829912.1 hypothetical protein HWA84_gp38 [Bacillus phage phi105]UQT53203.1 hypothetical protein M5C89_08335 [Bacillus velezensis]SLB09448.1 Uncharacterised protein [Mycobacteroides abscessus subsp. massiliense]ADF59171.1 hypothetical protein PHI105_00190 [Bacillus phage phi105]AUJ77570.1 hypothetical protein CWD84_12485 [Bacillus siamensis]MBF8236543.1 hypoth
MKLEEIRQRADAATEGPWRIGKQSPNGLNNIGTIGGLLTAQTTNEDDAKYIAHARQDIPWLISEIDRLNSGIDSVLYDLRNEDITNPHVVEQITENLVAVLNGK